jgi:hypothetical protein
MLTRMLDHLACFILGHDEALHYSEENGKLTHAGTYCTQCKKRTFPKQGGKK